MRTWRNDAACVGHDAELWFSATVEDVAEAKRICASCPVTAICAAMASTEKYGTWAGRTEVERGHRHEPVRVFRRSCTIDGCHEQHRAQGFCMRHYRQMRNGGVITSRLSHLAKVCATDGCERPRRAKEWCDTCYRRNRRRERAAS